MIKCQLFRGRLNSLIKEKILITQSIIQMNIQSMKLTAAKSLIDSLFMFEPKQNDLDPNLLFAKCINKIEDNT